MGQPALVSPEGVERLEGSLEPSLPEPVMHQLHAVALAVLTAEKPLVPGTALQMNLD